MKYFLCFAFLFYLSSCALGKQSPPKVQVYSRNPGKLDDANQNTLICHVSGFHPPDITIILEKNGVEIPGAQQTDLAFESGWQFHLTKYVPFQPKKGETYTCKVRHMTTTKTYTWEPDM
ncbi:beta-2-microglobulin-like [Sardina pilchardus]|uniref:beta-2-microglobulin-like n=1 Tax=Sardina pilchardus TaxID=27697 RepID=UPI002E117AFE